MPHTTLPWRRLAAAALVLLSACVNTTPQKEHLDESVAATTGSTGPLPRPETPAPAPQVASPAAAAKAFEPRRGRADKHAEVDLSRHRLLRILPAPGSGVPYADAARLGVKGQRLDPNPVRRAAADPVSTFSIDVDTGSYSSVRGLVTKGMDVPGDVVRVEEMINYFDYAYARPERQRGGKRPPFAFTTTLAPAPWNPSNHLLRIGIQAEDAAKDELPPANLVFLVDVSGSMNIPESLPLVREALAGFTRELRPRDRVSIVTYASGTQVWLPSTPGSERERIARAIEDLRAGGSTAGASGIRLAYEQARAGFIQGGINRILLATDGDFNVGVADVDQLKEMVARQRRHGISLSTLGVGHASYNDRLMEQIADAGDGKYSFLDSLDEARKVLHHEFTSTLHTVAQDVKIQVEFNPAVVKEYRLIGYENRVLAQEDFRNDQVDAGDIGAGHRVTALYEITLQGRPGLLEEPRYATPASAPAAGRNGELAHLRLRYKAPSDDPTQQASVLLEHPVAAAPLPAAMDDADFRFAAAVAAFGQMLGPQAKYTGRFGYDDVARLARSGLGADEHGLRRGFVSLVEHVAQRQRQAGATQPVDGEGPRHSSR